ncbi:MAG TPA: Gfo/Idh/MocA family oxidoreductase [Chthoniobacterales bacterium]
MPMPLKMIHVGLGGWGERWCKVFLPPNVQGGLIDVRAVVDLDTKALEMARSVLGLRSDQCYTDVREAFEKNQADFCTIVVPPAFHEKVVDEALAHDLHILSEKPIADTLLGSVRIAAKVKRSGKKMGVTMSHRFDQDKATLRQLLHSGRYGQLDYLVCRFTCEARKFATWGKFRHEIEDALMVEGAVHHLDILADLASAKCESVYAETWNPPWGEFAGDSQALVTMHFPNQVRALYEGAKTNAVGLNGWANEYIRAECREATVILDRRQIEYFPYEPKGRWTVGVAGQGKQVPLLQQAKWANTWLIEKFVRWVEGGEPMETNVEDNLQSVALIFAGIQSARSGKPVLVQEMLCEAQEQASLT